MHAFWTATLLATTALGHYNIAGITRGGDRESRPSRYTRQTNFLASGGNDVPMGKLWEAGSSKEDRDRLACDEHSGDGDDDDDGLSVLEVRAGDTFTMQVRDRAARFGNLGHEGYITYHLARVPPGEDIRGFKATGEDWFKIYEEPGFWCDIGDSDQQPGRGHYRFASKDATEVAVTIPRCVGDGEYLLRAEHLALHQAWDRDNFLPQFFVSCSQIRVKGMSNGGGGGGGQGEEKRAREVDFKGERIRLPSDEGDKSWDIFHKSGDSYPHAGMRPIQCEGEGEGEGRNGAIKWEPTSQKGPDYAHCKPKS